MSHVCVLFAEGFEEIEAVSIVDILRRADVDVTTLGVAERRVTGSHGITVETDRSLAEASSEIWDMVILPGGIPGSTHLRDSPEVQKLIREQASSGRRIGAICAGPIALGAAGVLQGRRATSYPGFERELSGCRYSEDRVVTDGNIITSRGPGTAMEFALEVVRELRGGDVAGCLRKGMLVGS